MVEGVIAVGLLAHGLGHVIGFAVPWGMDDIEGLHPRSAFFDRLDLGWRGARVVGLAWLAVALLYGVAGAAVWLGAPWAVGLTLGTTVLSAGICVLGLPETLLSLGGDAVIVAALTLVMLGA